MTAKKKTTSKKASQKERKKPKLQGEFRSSDKVGTALIEASTFRGKAVQYAVVDGMAVFEGDIILGTVEEVEAKTKQLRAEMSGELAAGVVRSGTQYRWPNCRVPYTIDSSLPNQSRVTDAIAHWESNTNYTFVLRTSETDYVTFRPSSGCSSSVGRQGGQQFVNLGSGCSTGNAIHEIGHTIGLWHEQSREDRDSFVTIHWDKIIAGYEHNFNQHIADGDDVGPYDYGSIMHYPRNAFSVDGSDTITPTDPTATIGQRTALSAGDIAAANSLCPLKILKEGWKDRFETIKEIVKDIRFDTRKETVLDTLKEQVLDPIKRAPFDPLPGTLAEQVVNPGRPPLGMNVVRPLPTGPQPFAVATPHQAPAALGGADVSAEAVIGQLDAQLQALAEQLAQAQTNIRTLQAQYDETAALLEQALRDQEGSGGTGR